MPFLPPQNAGDGRGVPAPRMAADPMRFFPTLLCNDVFQRDGLLFGVEAITGLRVHWAVVDPGRYAMYVWERQSMSYPLSARELGASMVTNGPFTTYGDGSLANSTVRFLLDAAPLAFGAPLDRHWKEVRSDLSDVLALHFRAPAPLGFVLGAREGISETRKSRPNMSYFGRRGFEFDDYRISRGDPINETEAIGGLFGAVNNYEPYSVNRVQRVGYWGLAPLRGEVFSQPYGVEPSLDRYEAITGRRIKGLLVFVAGWANTRHLTRLLSAIRVKDAVQVDGGDSLLLAEGGVFRQGAFMPPWKRMMQRWGIQVRPLPEKSPSSA